MRHVTRQLCGERARHGVYHLPLAGRCTATWPAFSPPLTNLVDIHSALHFGEDADEGADLRSMLMPPAKK